MIHAAVAGAEAASATTTPPPPLPHLQAQWPPATKGGDEQLATFAGGCFWSVELAFQVGAGTPQGRTEVASGRVNAEQKAAVGWCPHALLTAVRCLR